MKKNILLLALLQCSLLISCNNANNNESSNSVLSEVNSQESSFEETSNQESTSEQASNQESTSEETSNQESTSEETSNQESSSEETSNSSEEVTSSEEVNPAPYEAYGEFAITSENGEYTFNEETNTYTLSSASATYSLTGYLENGRIEISAEATKVTVELNRAAVISSVGSAIYYTADSKSLEVKSIENTVNYLVSGTTDDTLKATIQSENNIKLTGQGELNITSLGTAISGSDVSIKSSTINVTAEKNAIKAKQFAMVYNTEEDGTVYGFPSLNVLKASTAIKCELTSKGKKGSAYIFAGTIDCDDVETIFNVEADLYLSYEATWDDVNYTSQPVTVNYNTLSTLEECAGTKYTNEENVTINVK